MQAWFVGITLAAGWLPVLAHGTEAVAAEGVLIARESIALPSFEEISDRPLIHLYASEPDYNRARSDGRYSFERLSYSSDGLAVVALLYRPKGQDPLPTIVFNRGSYLRNETAPEYLTTFHRLAAAGYVVLAPMYRGSEGARGRDEMGGADLNDLLQTAALAKELPSVDASKLFLLGESRGGMMVFQALRDGFPALAAATYGAPTDFRRLFAESPEQYEAVADQLWPGWRADPEVLVKRSAIAWAEKIDIPLLLMHGGDDRSMPASQSLSFAARLQALGKPFELHVLAYENHQISGSAARRDKVITDWFALHASKSREGRD